MYALHLLCLNDWLNPTQSKSSKILGSDCLHSLFTDSLLFGTTHNSLGCLTSGSGFSVCLTLSMQPLSNVFSLTTPHHLHLNPCATTTTKASDVAQCVFWQPWALAWDHSGRRKPTASSCPLISIHTPQYTYAHTPKWRKIIPTKCEAVSGARWSFIC